MVGRHTYKFGAIAVYRQDADGDARNVALRGVRGSGSFVLRDAETRQPLGTFSAAQLRAGIPVRCRSATPRASC